MATAKLGRPKRSDKFGGYIARAETKIADNLHEVVDALLALALGVWVEEPDDKGGRKVYREPPDRQACEYLLNRIMGKPVARVESEQDGIMTIRLKYPDEDERSPGTEPDPT